MSKKARNLRTRYIASAVVALVMISYGVITSALNTRQNLADVDKVAHSRNVIDALGKSLSAMQDLELGQRGYLLVGEESYLDPYRNSLAKVDEYLDQVVFLTTDNPPQQKLAKELQAAGERKKAYLEETISIRRGSGAEAAQRVTATGRGKEIMDGFRAIVAEMEREENKLLIERNDTLLASLSRTNLVVALTGGIAILSGAIGVLLLLLFVRSQENMDRLLSEKDKAIQSDQAKSDFLAMMSHEIRTPMNAILGFGELLDESLETSQQKHYAKAILSSGNSLLLLINDILDLSKIEASKLELHPDVVEMSGFSESIETLFSLRATEKGLAYSVELDASVPPLLTFDALRVRQILVNLIGNALKFTQQGYVRVRVSVSERPNDSRVSLNFEVTDTGIGISQDQLRQIFRPFYQVDSRNSRQFQGTGLGLNISERLASLMEGKVTVGSELGKGSTFCLSIPVARSSRMVPHEAEIKDAVDFDLLAPAKILIADDVPLNRELILGYFHGSHHELYEAESGEQAIVLCRKYLPDIVLLDIRMPVMDGREIRLRLKSMEETKHIPLIALSASSLLDRQIELKALFDGFADKPLNRVRLFTELSRFLPKAEKPKRRVEASPPEEFRPAAGSDRTQDPDLLFAALIELEESQWPDLVKLVPAQATIAFAQRLSSLAIRHESAILAEYATGLRKAAETLDLESAGKLLKVFPETIRYFSHSDA